MPLADIRTNAKRYVSFIRGGSVRKSAVAMPSASAALSAMIQVARTSPTGVPVLASMM
jgi:hypothetical protein